MASVIRAEQPNDFYTNCYGHRLNLAVAVWDEAASFARDSKTIAHIRDAAAQIELFDLFFTHIMWKLAA